LSSQITRQSSIASILRSRIHQKKHERAVAANSVIKKSYNLNELRAADNSEKAKRQNAIIEIVKLIYKKITEESYHFRMEELGKREKELKEKKKIKEKEYHQLVVKLKQRSKLKNSANQKLKTEEAEVQKDVSNEVEKKKDPSPSKHRTEGRKDLISSGKDEKKVKSRFDNDGRLPPTSYDYRENYVSAQEKPFRDFQKGLAYQYEKEKNPTTYPYEKDKIPTYPHDKDKIPTYIDNNLRKKKPSDLRT